MNIVLLMAEEIGADGRASLTDRRAEHLLRVLRVQPGAEVRVGLIDGPTGMAVVEEVGPAQVVLSCRLDGKTPERPRVDVLLAMPRPKVLGRQLVALANLGVGHIALSNAWRVERSYFHARQADPAFCRQRLIEGLELSGCTRLPTLSLHERLVPLVEERLDVLFGDARRLIAHPGAGALVGAVLSQQPAERVLLALGPEGGWIERELSMFARFGFEAISLGPRILATQTASCVGVGLIHEALTGHG